MPKDLYGILGLSKAAELNEIRKNYLKLSRQFHPDKVSNEQKFEAEEKFKAISEAYEILSDENKKSFYDQTGQIPGENGNGHGHGGMGHGMPFPFDMNQMFGMFGQGGGSRPMRGRRPGKAPSRKTQISLTLNDYYYGRTLQVKLERQRFCSHCKGEGCINSVSCTDCNGQGVKRQIIQMGPMIMENTGPCPKCSGSGKNRGDNCNPCGGSKFIKQDKILELNIKKGMKPGDNVVFSGESSNVEEFQEAGDVIVELQAADEETSFVREGSLLKATVSIGIGESLCGTKVIFNNHPGYPNGIVLDVPIGVQNKTTLVFNGLGMPIEDNFGELHLMVEIKQTTEEINALKNNLHYFQGLFVFKPKEIKDDMKTFTAHRFH
jgi:DnaJ family protein A protein 2